MAGSIQNHKNRTIKGKYLRKLSSLNDAKKDDIRKSVQLAARKALNNAQISDTASHISVVSDFHGSNRSRLPSLDYSHDSLLSQERAVHRGSKRGLFENNEIAYARRSSFSDYSSDFELTTASGSLSESKGSKSKWKFLVRKRKKKMQNNFLTSEITQEAWMCGVCAKSFASLEAAEKHEDYHIKEVVEDLGWGINTGIGNENADDMFNNNALGPPQQRQNSHPGDTLADVPLSPVAEQHVQKKSAVSFELRESNIPRTAPNILNGRPKLAPIDEQDLLVPTSIREYVVLADEALVDVCGKAQPLILTQDEVEAELELELLAKDKSFYDLIAERALKRRTEGAYSRFRTEGTTILNKVQNKFVDAYALMKEGNSRVSSTLDHYNRRSKGDTDTQNAIEHSNRTLYVNVIVKNSIQVVSHELERLAKQRWEDTQTGASEGKDDQAKRFQKFRALAQGNLVKLAGLALASDFTPRRIAVQLSNDLYRLLTPRLKKRGVFIETEIEYRVGPYFVLAVNIKSIDWTKLVKMTHRDVAERKSRWVDKNNSDDVKQPSGQAGVIVSFATLCYHLSRMTRYEVLAQFLAWLHYCHWIISTPICFLLYHLVIGSTFRTYFLSSVADEIFFYVEEKGMEMEVDIRESATQAAFMLSALRELRADGRELKKKRKESESASKGTILGPLLGPLIKADSGPGPSKPDGFDIPENLEFIGLELDLPVGYRRLRWAMLHSSSTFVTEGVFRSEAKYDDITTGSWSKHDDHIGLPSLPDDVSCDDFIDAEKETSYLMPKSAFVKANMCYETAYIEAYNDYCFSLKKKALTPDVPYGNTFIAWTKYTIINTGSGSCKIICSVEAEFPNGPPLISRQIKSGMRAGVAELFVQIGETITKYADEYP